MNAAQIPTAVSLWASPCPACGKTGPCECGGDSYAADMRAARDRLAEENAHGGHQTTVRRADLALVLEFLDALDGVDDEDAEPGAGYVNQDAH